jgi:prepilin-type N-terminal cleavage/methylation domain-containing protein
MNGKQKGFTLIEILVVVTIIGVLAGLVVVLIPKSQEAVQRTECQNHQKQICGLLINEDAAWRKSGANIALYFVVKKDIQGTNLKLLFCPGDTQNTPETVGGEAAYKDLDLDTHQYDHLTSYAGRDQTRKDCQVKKGMTSPEVMTCDDSEKHHNSKGFVCGYNDGSAKWMDKYDAWKINLDTPINIGEGSEVPALKCVRAD